MQGSSMAEEGEDGVESMDTENLTLSNLISRNSKSKRNSNRQLEEWEKDKEIYELQLNQLQEQLLAMAVQNQQLTEKNKKLQKHDVEDLTKMLEEEKSQRRRVEERLERLLSSAASHTSQKKSMDQISLEYDDLSVELNETKDEEHPPEKGPQRSRLKKSFLEYKISVWNFFHERISDFINDDDHIVEEEEPAPLSLRELKENLGRFTDAIQPIKSGYTSLDDLFSWKNPWLTIGVFLIFMYSVWLEMYVPLCLMLLLMQLTFNYLHARGIAQKFTQKRISKNMDKEDSKDEPTKLSDRYQLVLKIARMVQNKLGMLADNLEKLQNLFLWQHHEATKKLYSLLFVAFLASCLLSTSKFLLCLGLAIGIKLFIITPIYARFPKVQKRYDDLQRLWQDLPTHSENLQRQIESISTDDDLEQSISTPRVSSPQPAANETGSFGTVRRDEADGDDDRGQDVSWNAIVFSDRFQVPSSETPLHDWIEGRRCTLMDKDSPLSSMKHGRLYLTANYICFERNQFHSKKNISIKLTEITSVKKCKPISFMPGTGMAIEVCVKQILKPYIFAAMMGRDDALESIIRAGKLLGLGWARS